MTIFERPWRGGSRNHIGDQFGWWNQHHLGVARTIKCRSCFVSVSFFFFFSRKERERGRVVRAPDLKSVASGFKSLSRPLAVVVLGSPEFNFSAALVNSQLVCLPPVGILNLVMFIWIFIYHCVSTLDLKRGVANNVYIHVQKLITK